METKKCELEAPGNWPNTGEVLCFELDRPVAEIAFWKPDLSFRIAEYPDAMLPKDYDLGNN